MECDQRRAPAEWIDAVAKATDDIAHDRTVSVDEVHDELHVQLVELEVEVGTLAVNAPGC